MDTGSVEETVEAEGLVVKVIMVYEVDSQVVGVAGIDDGFDWVDGVTEVADRVDIHRVIGFL